MQNKVLREAEVVVQAASAQLGEQLNNVEQNIGASSIYHFNQFTEVCQSFRRAAKAYQLAINPNPFPEGLPHHFTGNLNLP